jgi:hypothetical protein
MTTKLVSPRGGDLKFKAGESQETAKGEKVIPSMQERGRVSTQESEDESVVRSPSRRGLKSGRQGEFSGAYDKEGHHLKADGTPDMRFKENREEFEGKGFEYTSPKRTGRQTPLKQEDEVGSRSQTPRRLKSGRQGEFSGAYDKSGHHLKADRSPDMRFKENRQEFSGEGYEYTSPKRIQKGNSFKFEEKERGEKVEKDEKEYRLRRKKEESEEQKTRKPKYKPIGPSKEKERKGKPSVEHSKSDGTPDMRFKENRDKFSGQGYENLTTRTGRGQSTSKANIGIFEGNVPGEHSGKFDKRGHHLKQDGTPDMRFKENRYEFSGKGFETAKDEHGNTRKSAKYLREGDEFTHTIYYRRRRPPTPYAIYIRENAPEMKKKNPDMDMNEVFRELGEKWRSSSEKEHRKYYDLYDEEVKRFQYSSQFPHRGPLAFRKFAQEHGLSRGTYLSPSKKSKNERGNKRIKEEQKDDDKEYDEDENENPNEAITA